MIAPGTDPEPEISFFVPGVPQPGGSKKGFARKNKQGGISVSIVEDAKKNAPWRAVVSLAARDLFPEPLTGPLRAVFEFAMPRPRHHFGTGRNAHKLRDSAPHYCTRTPDITKLIRSTEDALTGIAWVDDAQIVDQLAIKVYGGRPGCQVTIRKLTAEK